MKNKLTYCNVRFVFQNKCKISNFLHFKTKFHRLYVLVLFTNFSAVAAMLPIMAKLNIILRSECVNTWEFLHSLGKELKMMMILPLTLIGLGFLRVVFPGGGGGGQIDPPFIFQEELI